MKRNRDYSSSDSETDENIEVGKESADENENIGSPDGSVYPSTTTKVQARKRRRGIIEKRRRDRINNSLSELRKLIPTAFEKQGSAKLEKAEILQMTVDHLKMLHSASGKGYFDAHALAMDYRSLGFRECLSETARYLSFVEGLDSAEPLRVRLVSHLSSYVCQREAHSGFGQLGWGSAFGTPPSHLAHRLPLQHQQLGQVPPRRSGSPHPAPSPPTSPSSPTDSPAPRGLTGTSPTDVMPVRAPLKGTVSSSLPLTTGGSSKLTPPLSSSLPAFPLSFSALPLLTPPVPPSSLGKPYRPWGTEIGAF